jgi:hypothetical protein
MHVKRCCTVATALQLYQQPKQSSPVVALKYVKALHVQTSALCTMSVHRACSLRGSAVCQRQYIKHNV